MSADGSLPKDETPEQAYDLSCRKCGLRWVIAGDKARLASCTCGAKLWPEAAPSPSSLLLDVPRWTRWVKHLEMEAAVARSEANYRRHCASGTPLSFEAAASLEIADDADRASAIFEEIAATLPSLVRETELLRADLREMTADRDREWQRATDATSAVVRSSERITELSESARKYCEAMNAADAAYQEAKDRADYWHFRCGVEEQGCLERNARIALLEGSLASLRSQIEALPTQRMTGLYFGQPFNTEYLERSAVLERLTPAPPTTP